jgi:hypothetical protein
MIQEPMDVLVNYPVRKSAKQKTAFIEAVKTYAQSLGYNCSVEKGSMGSQNVIIGDAEKAKYLVTAHYDTPASLFIPNFITPCNFLVFLLYQLAIVALFVVVAFVMGFVFGLITRSPELGGSIAGLVYWGMLIAMMVGPANKHNANDNTSGVVSVLEMARSMPEHLRDRVCFVLFDLEEAGLVGSSSFRKKHKKTTDNQIILNLDCVGDGDEIVMFPTKKFIKNDQMMENICRCVGHYGDKSIAVKHKGFRYYPSDQAHFPYGVGIAAFKRGKGIGLYCSRIHTNKDTILEETNVNILRAALTSMIGADTAE